jgi:EAL domain-containing protein (putative c-di-GMP-specific phosphodiesterase class I)
VLHQAAADLRRWQQLGNRPMRVAVNVSPVQLRQQDFPARFLAIAGLRAQGFGGLDVEITEGVLLEDPFFLVGTLQTLRDEGVRVAIDDFGTGYSSPTALCPGNCAQSGAAPAGGSPPSNVLVNFVKGDLSSPNPTI